MKEIIESNVDENRVKQLAKRLFFRNAIVLHSTKYITRPVTTSIFGIKRTREQMFMALNIFVQAKNGKFYEITMQTDKDFKIIKYPFYTKVYSVENLDGTYKLIFEELKTLRKKIVKDNCGRM